MRTPFNDQVSLNLEHKPLEVTEGKLSSLLFTLDIEQVKPGFTNYQPHPSSLGPEVIWKVGGIKIKE